ncbi:MAG: beta-galactosidase trimerization domain-containing protein [Planctomycetota bacterium]
MMLRTDQKRGFRLAIILPCVFLLLPPIRSLARQDMEQIDLPIVQPQPFRIPETLTIRVRLKNILPEVPTPIRWRHGGEGQGGEVYRGVFPKVGVAAGAPAEAHTLPVGQWSAPVQLVSLAERLSEKFFLTITAGNPGKTVDRKTGRRGGHSTDVTFEFEFRFADQVIKTFSAEGPDGGTATIVIPVYRLVEGVEPTSPEFLNELTDVLGYARRRAEALEKLPWASWPLPRKYAIINNVGGYGTGHGYGIRTTDRAVTATEMRSLRHLGVNGFRDGPDFVMEMLRKGGPESKNWNRAIIAHVMGFPVNRYRPGRSEDPQAGCPFRDDVADRTRRMVRQSLDDVLSLPVEEVWGLTVDEIGTVIDQSREKKAHLAVCPRCIRGFQDWLKRKGVKPSDFGASDWSGVRPLNVWDSQSDRPWLRDRGLALAAYYTRDFNNHVTAMMFTDLKKAFALANENKKAALARDGDLNRPKATQPWLYSYALRGNTFLMKGHSLDFFDFYREADNAIVYETSNRGSRIWGWDSYLCDVQRVVSAKMNLARGIYIKPHRGAPIQRMLSAVSRGNTMLYWYTYGPDYKKGDSFSQHPDALQLTSKAAHLLGAAEDALYGSRWAFPAEVAVVKPETTQRWMNLSGNPPHLTAAWENAKWVYTALQHAHVPVDPIDEVMLAEEDLSRYKIIYVSGSHITKQAAQGLVRYVENGGTLYTSGWGLVRDEANQPLAALQPVLGLQVRAEPEMWYRVSLYGATNIESYDERSNRLAPVPSGARIVVGETIKDSFAPVVGREVLRPEDDSETLVHFADGAAAMIRHKYGKGRVHVVGFFPGLEYSATVRRLDFNMRRDFDPVRRFVIAGPALELTRPVVEPSDPLVEGVLLKNAENGLRAVTLANWAYGVAALKENASGRRSAIVEHLPLNGLQIRIRATQESKEVVSCMLRQRLRFTESDDSVLVELPRLNEGDVLLLK